MSSTQAAYLTDLISEYWDKEKLTVYSTPNPPEGWQTNLLFNTGWYLGGIKKDCDGHPPVVNGHHTSWAVLVLNGMATDAESLNHNHRLQLAFDVVNSKIYMRRGWMSENTWADKWDEVGSVADRSITENKLTSSLTSLINETAAKAHAHENKSLLDGITAEDIQKWNNPFQIDKGHMSFKGEITYVGEVYNFEEGDTFFNPTTQTFWIADKDSTADMGGFTWGTFITESSVMPEETKENFINFYFKQITFKDLGSVRNSYSVKAGNIAFFADDTGKNITDGGYDGIFIDDIALKKLFCLPTTEYDEKRVVFTDIFDFCTASVNALNASFSPIIY